MKTRTSYAILAACLGVAPAAFGQSFLSDALGQPSPPQPLSHSMSLGNVTPPTPAQMAKMMQAARLAGMAAASLHAGGYAQAETEARQSLSVDLSSGGVSEEVLAAALAAQGKDSEALRQYQTVVEHYDRQPRNLLPYAQLLLRSGHWAQALSVYNQALPSLPDVGMHEGEAVILHDGDVLRANSHFSPDVPQPAALARVLYIAHGLVYDSTPSWAGGSQDKEAMGEYRKALQLDPDNALANHYYSVGWQALSPAERGKYATAPQAKTALLNAARTPTKPK